MQDTANKIFNFFFVRDRSRFYRIDVDRIKYIVATSHNSQIFTDDGMFWPHLQLKEIEERLPDTKFARINKKIIVALNRIVWYDRTEVALKEISFTLSNQYREFFISKICTLTHVEPTNENPTISETI